MHGRASLPVPQALFCRPFQRTVIRIRRQSLFLCGLYPFYKGLSCKSLKGVQTHRGIRQSRGLINPLIEINGKREPAAWGVAPLKEQTDKSSFTSLG